MSILSLIFTCHARGYVAHFLAQDKKIGEGYRDLPPTSSDIFQNLQDFPNLAADSFRIGMGFFCLPKVREELAGAEARELIARESEERHSPCPPNRSEPGGIAVVPYTALRGFADLSKSDGWSFVKHFYKSVYQGSLNEMS